jgi:hypothetical protein
MPGPWSSLAAVIGGTLAALVGGVLGGIISRRHEAGRWSRDQRMSAYAELIRSYAGVYNQIAVLDGQGRRGKPDWADWTRCLAVVYMVAETEVANQARLIDVAFYQLTINAGEKRIARPEWVALRDALDREVLAFVNVARIELGTLGPPLPALWGRPADQP